MKPRRWLEQGMDLVYPPRCPFCGSILTSRWELLCRKCADQEKEFLRRPATIMPERHSFYCVEKAIALYQYHHPMVNKAILKMKSSEPWYAAGFARLMAVRLFGLTPGEERALLNLSLEYDLLIPVPDSKGKRGFWVPGLMARELGRLVGLPVETSALVKVKATQRQATLERWERLTNLIGSFRTVKPEQVEGKRILLLDDVITTGSTLSCCAQALMEGGAAHVSGLSLAVSEEVQKM